MTSYSRMVTYYSQREVTEISWEGVGFGKAKSPIAHIRTMFLGHDFAPLTSLDKFISWFGNTFGQQYFLREGSQTTNLASINMTKLSAFPVPLPPVAEQKVILEEVEGISR